jgi:fluoroquinolone transport system permease protein
MRRPSALSTIRPGGVNMKKYLTLLRYEFKTIVKNPMNLFMLLFPFLILFMCGWLIPAILQRTGASTNATTITMLLSFAFCVSCGGYITGAMLGFSLLENRDENTLVSIAMTPMSVKGYTAFKSVYAFVFSWVGNFLMLAGLKLFAASSYVIDYGGVSLSLLDNITYFQTLVFSVISALVVPFFGGAFAAIAKNKIEGFALMKTGGLIIMIPLLCLLPAFATGWQYVLGLAPNFWAMKGLLNIAMQSQNTANLNFWLYMAIGAVYQTALSIWALHIFIKKAQYK